jgi:trimeric autotransporter adhesin
VKALRSFPFAATFFLLSCSVFSQSFVGEIRGLIQDPGGAVVAGANVTLRNEASNVSRTTVSNNAGEYVFAQVEPATYTIDVEAAGFKKLERRGITVSVQQQLGLDFRMEIGAVNESVQVTTEVPLLETTTGSNGQVTSTQQITDLPNLGRNTFLLSKFDNNVVPSGPPQWNRFEDQIGSSNLSIGGGPIRGNNYTVDGVPITSSQNLAIIIPAEEAVQEMKLQEGTYDATMGRTGGGVFNTVIKSGSNDIHGSVFGYLRNTPLTANNFFNNATDVAKPYENWENWGASIGGPVVIPKVYNGKNKTFFFVSTEGYLEGQPAAGSYAVPTAAELTGNFSAAGKTIYNPLDSVPCSSGAAGCVQRTPFAGNIIPASQINSVGQSILSYLPAPNYNLSGNVDQDNFHGTDTVLVHAEEFVYRLDEAPTNWLHLSGSFMYYKSHEPGGNTLTTLPGSGSYLLDRHVDATAVNAIATINPTTVFTARFGFNRFPNIYNYVSEGFNQTTLGLPASYVDALQVKEFPGISLSQASDSFGGGSPSNIVYWSKNASFNVSKYVGKHNLTMGFDYRLIHTDGISWSTGYGSFTFNGIFTAPTNQSATGVDFADALLGDPSAGSVATNAHEYYFVNYYSGYVQDDIRIMNRLTVNVGLRYEYETGESEQYNNMLVGFNQTALNPIQALLPSGSGVLANGLPLIAGQNGNPTSCCDALKDHFGPRAGFAFQADNKTTIRGGYGIFYAPIYFSLDNQFSPGFSQTTTYLASSNGNATPANSLTNPYPNGVLQPTNIESGVLEQLGSTTYFASQNRTQGIVQQYSLDVQRQIPGNIVLEVGYFGARSSRLQYGSTGNAYLPINQVPTADLSLGSALAAKVNNPFYGLPNVGGTLAAATVSQAQLLMPFPEYSQVYEATNLGKAQYDSMIVKAQKRLSKGLTFLATFTWSKNEDNLFGSGGSNYWNTYSGSTPPAYPQNVYNLAGEWGLASGTTPLRSTATWTYQLPFGNGKHWLNSSRALDYLAGGWSVNGTMVLSDGFPLFIYQTNNNSLIGAQVQRPNATGVSPAISGSPEQNINEYINPAAFSLAAPYTFGNVSRSLDDYGPGIINFDLSVFKNFGILKEGRIKAQFRAEALNAFNTPEFGNPNTQFLGVSANGSAVGNFGKLVYQMNLPREFQLGLRFWF